MDYIIHISTEKSLIEIEKEIQNLLKNKENIFLSHVEEEHPKDEIHLWDGHGKAKCGESCWGNFPSLDVVKTIRLTLYDKHVTCRKCKNILKLKEARKIMKM